MAFEMIVKKFKDWLLSGSDSAPGTDAEESIKMAAAILMLEISRADQEMSILELETACTALAQQFALTDEEANEFLQYAIEQHEQHVSAHELIRTLNSRLSEAEKIKLVETLWHIAFINGDLHKYEEYHIRKISDWLYVRHSDFIRAKHKALEQPGTPS